MVLTFGTGRTLRATIREVSPMEQPQHKLVSAVGNLTRDGKASPYEVVMRLADRVGAQCYPMPTPVVAESQEQRRFLHDQQWAKVTAQLAAGARLSPSGIGPPGWKAHLPVEGSTPS